MRATGTSVRVHVVDQMTYLKSEREAGRVAVLKAPPPPVNGGPHCTAGGVPAHGGGAQYGCMAMGDGGDGQKACGGGGGGAYCGQYGGYW